MTSSVDVSPSTQARREARLRTPPRITPRDSPPPRDGPWRGALRLPLLGKLVGANALVASAGVVALVTVHRDLGDDDVLLAVAIAGLLAGVLVSVLLMLLALQPVARMRATLHRFAYGDLAARIRPSLLADRDLQGVGDAVNELLDDLVAERARMRQLAKDTIRGADEERARIARGLHDSTAQTLAALSVEARMALQLEAGRELTEQLELIKDLAIDALEEVRELSQAIHPRVLDDLGLAAALGWLARSVREATGLESTLQFSGETTRVRGEPACALFRVAEAALASASAEGNAHRAELRLDVSPEGASLDVRDDGPTPDRSRERLESLRERVALSGGSLSIHDHDGHGQHVHAIVPLGPAAGKELP